LNFLGIAARADGDLEKAWALSADGHGVASLDSPGATHLSIHADVDFVVACRCAQDPAVLRTCWESDSACLRD
jgi:hypothetical protein